MIMKKREKYRSEVSASFFERAIRVAFEPRERFSRKEVRLSVVVGRKGSRRMRWRRRWRDKRSSEKECKDLRLSLLRMSRGRRSSLIHRETIELMAKSWSMTRRGKEQENREGFD